MDVITIAAPPLPTEAWLREQLGKFSLFRYDECGGSTPCIELFDSLNSDIDRSESPETLLAAVDSIFDGAQWLVYQQVVFEVANVAYVGPSLFALGGERMDLQFGALGYRMVSQKTDWIGGMAALARSLASRLRGIAQPDMERVEQAFALLEGVRPCPIYVAAS